MCGIAGILFKKPVSNQVLGRALADMMDGCQHRGPDSTGFALYEKDVDGLRLRFLVDDEQAVARIKKVPDPVIETIVSGWPRKFDAARATALGFKAEGSFEEIIRSDDDSEGRKKMNELVENLQAQGDAIAALGAALGYEVSLEI